MVSMMRGRLGKQFYKAVLWLTLIAMAGTTLIAALLGRRGLGLKHGSAVATVNGMEIGADQLMKKAATVEHEIREIKAMLGNYADSFLHMRGYVGQPRDIAMNELVRGKLLWQAVQSLGVKNISPLYMAEKLDDRNFVAGYLSSLIPQTLSGPNGALDREALRTFLQRQGIPFADFEAQVEEAIAVSLLSPLLASVAYVPKSSGALQEARKKAERSFTFITLPISAYIENQKEIAVSDAVLKGYCERENAKNRRYWSREKRSGTIWVFTKDSFEINSSEAELRRYFNQHKKEFGDKEFAAVKSEIETTLAQTKFQNQFTASARSVLNDKIDAKDAEKVLNDFIEKHEGKKQIITDITREEAAKNNADASILFALSKPGKRTFAFKKNRGLIVILDTLTPAAVRPFEKVRAEVLEDYQKEEALKALYRDSEKIAKLAIGVDDLAAVARLGKKATIKTFEHVVPGDETWKKFEKEGYPIKRLEYMIHPGYTLIYLEDDKGVVAVLKSLQQDSTKEAKTSTDTQDKNLIELETQRIFTALIASLKSSANIKYGKERPTQGQIPLDLI